jgi:cytochrome c biogenesis protein CcdA
VAELLAGAATALWLGILTSISPCPLATNVAAVSYVGTQVDRPRRVVWAGLLYAAGRALAYVAVGGLLVLGLLSAPALSHGLQRWMTAALGPILILTGLVLLGAVRLPLGGRGVSESLQRRVDRMGLPGAALLGFVFALSFCPISAALFFGSLVPLALETRSSVLLPSAYGLGTAVPVLGFAIPLGLGASWAGMAFDRVTQVGRWARWLTAAVFLAIGAWYTARATLGIF